MRICFLLLLALMDCKQKEPNSSSNAVSSIPFSLSPVLVDSILNKIKHDSLEKYADVITIELERSVIDTAYCYITLHDSSSYASAKPKRPHIDTINMSPIALGPRRAFITTGLEPFQKGIISARSDTYIGSIYCPTVFRFKITSTGVEPMDMKFIYGHYPKTKTIKFTPLSE